MGHYGVCEHCGKAIKKARLKAIPFATLCVSCKEKEEREEKEYNEKSVQIEYDWKDCMINSENGETEETNSRRHFAGKGIEFDCDDSRN